MLAEVNWEVKELRQNEDVILVGWTCVFLQRFFHLFGTCANEHIVFFNEYLDLKDTGKLQNEGCFNVLFGMLSSN